MNHRLLAGGGKMRKILCVSFLLLCFSDRAYPWWSLGVGGISTHLKISSSVVSEVTETGNYADIRHFSDLIINGTSTVGNDKNAHGFLLWGIGDAFYYLTI